MDISRLGLLIRQWPSKWIWWGSKKKRNGSSSSKDVVKVRIMLPNQVIRDLSIPIRLETKKCTMLWNCLIRKSHRSLVCSYVLNEMRHSRLKWSAWWIRTPNRLVRNPAVQIVRGLRLELFYILMDNAFMAKRLCEDLAGSKVLRRATGCSHNLCLQLQMSFQVKILEHMTTIAISAWTRNSRCLRELVPTANHWVFLVEAQK